MGAGKSAIGRRLATVLDVPFADVDQEIEAAAGRSVSEIFSDFGEAEFRRGERAVIKRLLDGQPMIMALGGGAYIDAETRALVNDKGIAVWLKAELPVLVERVTRRNTRPLLSGRDPETVLTELLLLRTPCYAESAIAVQSDMGSPARVVDDLCDRLLAHHTLRAL